MREFTQDMWNLGKKAKLTETRIVQTILTNTKDENILIYIANEH